MFRSRFAGIMAPLLTLALAASIAGCSNRDKPRVRTDVYGDPLPPGAIARLGTLRLRGWGGPIVFSPDGKYIVTAAGSGGAQAVFWDRGSGRRVKALTAKEGIIRLAFSPDGKKLAAAGNGGFFNPVWDLASDKELFTFKGREIAFRAEGKELISTYPDSMGTKVRTIDADTGRQVTEWNLPHTWDKERLILSPDERFAAAPRKQADGGGVVIFDLAKRAKVKKLGLAQEQFQPIDFSNDGLRLIARCQEGFCVWEWSSGKVLRRWAGNLRIPAAFSPDGRCLAWIGADDSGIYSLWTADVEAGRPRSLRTMTSDSWHQPPVFSPDGKSIAVLTEGNAVALFDSRSGRAQLPLLAHEGRIYRVAYSSDGRLALTDDSHRLLVWDAATGRLLRRLPDDLPEGETILINTATHGRIVTVTWADGSLHLRDVATAKELWRLEGKDGYIVGVLGDISAVSADGKYAAILGPAGIRIYDLDTGAIRCQFTRDHPIWGMDFSADGRILEVTIQDFKKGLLPRFYDARTGGKIEASVAASAPTRRGGRWRDDSEKAKARLLALKLLDARGQPAFAGADGFITNVHESPGSRYLAVEGRSGLSNVINDKDKSFIRIYDTATRRLLVELDEKQQIGGFSADGRTFVSTEHSTGAIHLWEIATGRERRRLAGHLPGNVAIGFRPDGRVLLSGGADTQAFLWDVTCRAPDGARHEIRHLPERLGELWQTLAGDDAAAAYRAIWLLVDAPSQTVAWLREYLPPVAAVEKRHLRRLLADLDSDAFTIRSKASEELERLGELAEPALRNALAAKPTLECRRRCEDLLAKLAVVSGRRLRAVRAVEVLEHLGTAEARALVEKWSHGAPAARQTQEARATLARMANSRR